MPPSGRERFDADMQFVGSSLPPAPALGSIYIQRIHGMVAARQGRRGDQTRPACAHRAVSSTSDRDCPAVRSSKVRGAVALGTAAASMPSGAEARPFPRFGRVRDLTHTLTPEFPTFFGVPGIGMKQIKEFKKDGFNLMEWTVLEHSRHAHRHADPFLRERCRSRHARRR